jgi:hypothetical protein
VSVTILDALLCSVEQDRRCLFSVLILFYFLCRYVELLSKFAPHELVEFLQL